MEAPARDSTLRSPGTARRKMGSGPPSCQCGESSRGKQGGSSGKLTTRGEHMPSCGVDALSPLERTRVVCRDVHEAVSHKSKRQNHMYPRRLHPRVAESPLVIAANRDERLDRPASGPTRWAGEKFFAPRDEQAGGTWLDDILVAAGFTLEEQRRQSVRKALPFLRPTIRGVARR